MAPEQLAEIVGAAIATTVEPLLSEVVRLRARIATLEDRPYVPLDRIHADLLTLHERVAVVEHTLPMPGPPGPPGQNGTDGLPGKAGLTYEGVFAAGKVYARGEIVTWDGSGWHCNEDGTTTRPGDGSGRWTLFTKRGRDGKDVSR